MIEQTKVKRKTPKEDLTREEENILYWAGVLALPLSLLGLYIAMNWIMPYIPQSECIFWYWMKAYCPGCGGTRAVRALLRGEFLLSFWYHPFVLYVVVLYAIFMLTHTLEKLHVPFVKGVRFRVAWLYGALSIIGINFVLKNVLKFGFGIMM